MVCEAVADRKTAAELADRILCADVAWIEPEDLDLYRRWQGLEEGAGHLEWHHVPELARRSGIRAHGHFEGRPGSPDAHAARLALLLFATLREPPDAVVLVRDTDGEEERRAGLEQARQSPRAGGEWPFPVVLGLAHPKRECWVIAGFEPQDEAEAQSLAALRSHLGNDPRLHAVALKAKSPGALRSAKRVLAVLTDGDPAREAACWVDCDLDLLRQRGQPTGLTAYLEEVKALLVPLLSDRRV